MSTQQRITPERKTIFSSSRKSIDKSLKRNIWLWLAVLIKKQKVGMPPCIQGSLIRFVGTWKWDEVITSHIAFSKGMCFYQGRQFSHGHMFILFSIKRRANTWIKISWFLLVETYLKKPRLSVYHSESSTIDDASLNAKKK
jgi:hypothetical protein